MSSALLAREHSQFVLIDMQQRLAGAMPAQPMQAVEKNCGVLLQTSQLLEIPITVTEQYPKGLGPTLESLTPWLGTAAPLEKTCFSCGQLPAFRNRLDQQHSQIVLAGMETHICILQTALELQSMGKQVFVVEDAVLSRNPDSKANALQRLRQAGVIVTNTESVAFEWLGSAEGDAFKQISRLLR